MLSGTSSRGVTSVDDSVAINDDNVKLWIIHGWILIQKRAKSFIIDLCCVISLGLCAYGLAF